jgi:hypothetical protein
MSKPEFNYKTIVDDSGNAHYVNRLLVATPVTGLVRVEWVAARYGQLIPCNWSMVTVNEFINAYMPLRYQVADAQNMIVKYLVEGDFQWLLMIEHDTMPPPDAFIRINEYIKSEEVPIVSGLYYTKSVPSEPLVYRGRGTSYYDDWELGDLVWCDGIPNGFMLVHGGILRAMWEESPEYKVSNNRVTRRVFDTPRQVWHSPDSSEFYSLAGTSDLAWCTRIMNEGFFEKAGWEEYQEKEYPFLVDTNIFCRHIEMDGTQYP